jgi:hypothetical protein
VANVPPSFTFASGDTYIEPAPGKGDKQAGVQLQVSKCLSCEINSYVMKPLVGGKEVATQEARKGPRAMHKGVAL